MDVNSKLTILRNDKLIQCLIFLFCSSFVPNSILCSRNENQCDITPCVLSAKKKQGQVMKWRQQEHKRRLSIVCCTEILLTKLQRKKSVVIFFFFLTTVYWNPLILGEKKIKMMEDINATCVHSGVCYGRWGSCKMLELTLFSVFLSQE